MKFVPFFLAACLVGVTVVGPAVGQPGGGGPGGPGPGGAGPGGAGPGGGRPSPNFVFNICNQSDSPEIYIAVVSLAGQRFRAQGWWKVPRGSQCTKIGDFQRPGLFVHAADTQGNVWGQGDLQICANLNGSFDYTWDGAKRNCNQNEEVIGFVKIELEPKYPGFSWTLK
jgi:hypothetical protein